MVAVRSTARKNLGIDSLIQSCRSYFARIVDHRKGEVRYPLVDVLMCGMAMYQLKDPSLLAFQTRRSDDANFRAVYGVAQVPSDTQMREILDEVDPEEQRPVFSGIFRDLQRGKVLESMRYLDEGLILSLDGVEYFSSKEIHCAKCLERQIRGQDGKEYYHQMLGAVIVHPEQSEVFPLMPEPIQREDGAQKNDCERNAAIRFLEKFRRDHPRLDVVVVEDGLSSNGPHIRKLLECGCHFILGAKDGDHAYLQEELDKACADGRAQTRTIVEQETGIRHVFVWVNDIPLNKTHPDIRINYLRYMEEHPDGRVKEFGWVTDIKLRRGNVERIMRAGRSRWKIENETFNTLKNQGYSFEHNFGHGKTNLATNFALLMMLAFLIDQIQQRTNKVFQAALAVAKSRRELWERIRNLWASYLINSFQQLYAAIAFGYQRPPISPTVFDTS